MHLGHICTPEDEHIRVLQIIIAAHRLIDTETADERSDSGGHAVACVWLQTVGAEACFHQFGGSITLPHGPLTGTEHTDALGTLGFARGDPFLSHGLERFLPGHRLEFSVLVVYSVGFAQQRLGEAVFTVENLRQEVSFNTVETLVDRSIRVSLTGDNLSVLDAHQDTAAGAAVTAGRLVPADTCIFLRCQCGLGDRQCYPGNRCGSRNRIALYKITSS